MEISNKNLLRFLLIVGVMMAFLYVLLQVLRYHNLDKLHHHAISFCAAFGKGAEVKSFIAAAEANPQKPALRVEARRIIVTFDHGGQCVADIEGERIKKKYVAHVK